MSFRWSVGRRGAWFAFGPLKNARAPEGGGDTVILLIWLVALFAIAGVFVMAMR